MKKVIICVMMFFWCGIAAADEWKIYKDVLDEFENVRDIAVTGVEYIDYGIALFRLTMKINEMKETPDIDPDFFEKIQVSYFLYMKAVIDWTFALVREETDYEEMIEESWTAASVALDEAIAIYEALADTSRTPADIEDNIDSNNTSGDDDGGGNGNIAGSVEGDGDGSGFCFIGSSVASF